VPRDVVWWHVAATALAAGGTLFLLRWDRASRLLERLGGVGAHLPPLPWSAVLAGATLFLAAWVTYGMSFWLLARGLIPTARLDIGTALRTFAAGYIVGWLALFAPGGVGVRELAYVGLLTPSVGAGPALGISLGSRLLLTITELGAAGVMMLAARRAKGEPFDAA
jgi:hypothetical protein